MRKRGWTTRRTSASVIELHSLWMKIERFSIRCLLTMTKLGFEQIFFFEISTQTCEHTHTFINTPSARIGYVSSVTCYYNVYSSCYRIKFPISVIEFFWRRRKFTASIESKKSLDNWVYCGCLRFIIIP